MLCTRAFSMKEFIMSYTGADVAWADWMAITLGTAGYDTIHQARDFRGQNFVSDMKKALEYKWTIAVCSPNYFNSIYGEDEWTAAFKARKLILVKVRDCEIPTLLGPVPYVSLVALQAPVASAALLDGLKQRVEPAAHSVCTTKTTRFPGGVPQN